MATDQQVGRQIVTDVTSMTAKATGSLTARTVADQLATLPDSRVTVTGGTTPRSLADHLATLPDSTVTVPGGSARTLAAHLATLPDSQITATGSTTARTLAARFADTVNVKDFGASGDGATDDTVAIQNAVAYAILVRAKLIFPSGTYRLSTDEIVIDGSLSIEGAGGNEYDTHGTTILVAHNNAAKAGVKVGTVTPGIRFALTGCRFDAPAGYAAWAGLRIQASSVYVSHVNSTANINGVYLADTYVGEISHSTLRGADYALKMTGNVSVSLSDLAVGGTSKATPAIQVSAATDGHIVAHRIYLEAQEYATSMAIDSSSGLVLTLDGVYGENAGTLWVTGTPYAVGRRAAWNGNEYEVITSGTSGGSGPSGTGSDITDGSVHWKYLQTGYFYELTINASSQVSVRNYRTTTAPNGIRITGSNNVRIDGIGAASRLSQYPLVTVDAASYGVSIGGVHYAPDFDYGGGTYREHAMMRGIIAGAPAATFLQKPDLGSLDFGGASVTANCPADDRVKFWGGSVAVDATHTVSLPITHWRPGEMVVVQAIYKCTTTGQSDVYLVLKNGGAELTSVHTADHFLDYFHSTSGNDANGFQTITFVVKAPSATATALEFHSGTAAELHYLSMSPYDGGSLPLGFVRETTASTLSGDTAPSLLNSWVNYGGSSHVAGYYKDALGYVNLTGVVKSGTVGADIFVLPSGYRPAAEVEFPVISNGAVAWLSVTATGDVIAQNGSNVWFSLCGVRFKAEQ